ncbi:penicillin-binding protein 1C [Chitinimonas sp. BJYL2]|uniref:penicillin-binding protein 1C n=1 Tax=Chitinimonas sp. BJYL2 TaxID=2976696 RepID=UPI0022B32F99|nr:penicillin-binding protein 1C [Chitinimonas sp. BJYL2]
MRYALLALVLLLAACSAAPAPAEVRAGWRSSEAQLLDRHGTVIQQSRIDTNQRRLAWTPLDAISPELRAAVIAAEDRRFYTHHGVDWTALATALRDTLGGDPRGGSTLSMQLGSLLEPGDRPSGMRSPWQKLAQMVTALGLERRWRKHEIIEAYLNLAPWRGELVGIDAASRILFGKSPARLDRNESLLLASLLRAPNASAERVAGRACALGRQLGWLRDCVTVRALALARLHGPGQTVDAPRLAPELIAQLAPAAGARVLTTLDGRLQAAVRQQLTLQLAQLAGRNVRDGAAVIIDNASGDILAWVGNPGAGSGAAFVDGVIAPRQAGSTLKPLLYALAIEQGLLTAASPLADTPVALTTSAGQYVPQNYDRRFRGPVSVRTALAASLNIPAVRAQMLVGLEPFHQRLNDLGLSLPLPAAHYGHGLALGSAEVRLIDLANAYRALANAGRLRPWRLTPTTPSAPGQTLISPAASWIIADILADPLARASGFGLDSPLATARWAAVKTGTSKDMRDNWAIGFNGRYTVGVWVGNADGEAMWDVSGVSGAAPAWRAIMDLLPGTDAPAMPADVVRQAIHFMPAIEAPRTEYFVAGTQRNRIELGKGWAGPSILYPSDGMILALDPDISAGRQQLWLRASDADGLIWQMNGEKLGQARASTAWPLRSGRHTLALLDARGAVRDTVRFEVRGQTGRR